MLPPKLSDSQRCGESNFLLRPRPAVLPSDGSLPSTDVRQALTRSKARSEDTEVTRQASRSLGPEKREHGLRSVPSVEHACSASPPPTCPSLSSTPDSGPCTGWRPLRCSPGFLSLAPKPRPWGSQSLGEGSRTPLIVGYHSLSTSSGPDPCRAQALAASQNPRHGPGVGVTASADQVQERAQKGRAPC